MLGELEVSRDILESDHGINVRSFRAGHLCYPDSLGMGLVAMGYEFNSTYSANDILTSFPYYAYDDHSFSGSPTNVLEIPMTISDVFSNGGFTSDNYMQRVALWIDASRRYERNNSPVNLLIHPNRGFKLHAMQVLLDSIPGTMKAYGFESYAEFRRKRDSLHYYSSLENDTLYVYMTNASLDERQSFVIDDSGVDTVLFFDVNGAPITFKNQVYSATQHLYYQQENTMGTNELAEVSPSFSVYPNPTSGVITLSTQHEPTSGFITVTDITGKVVYQNQLSEKEVQINLSDFCDHSGLFFVQLRQGNEVQTKKVLYMQH